MLDKTRSWLAPLALASALLLSEGSAAADIPPPVGWKETCTLELTKKPGEECLSCSAYYGNAQHCSLLLGGYDYTSRCKTRGASVWGEIWCRTASPSAKKVPQNILTALSSATDNAGLDAKPDAGADATAAPSTTTTTSATTTATATTSATATSTPDPTVAPTSEPRPRPSDDTPKKGACGACTIGSRGAPDLGFAVVALAIVLGLARRRRR